MNVNILYLTNQCNLRCPYCYEQQGVKRKKRIITYKEIDEYLDNLVKTEPENVSTLCLMGGEPLLEIKKIKYIFDKCKKYKETINKNIAINIISNGTLLHTMLPVMKEMLTSTEVHMSLDISFDGSYQNIRTPNSDIVQRNLQLCRQNGIPFGLSFTITKNTVVTHLEEIIIMLETYFPVLEENRINFHKKKIRINYATEELMEVLSEKEIKQLKSALTKASLYLYTKYEVALCEHSCGMCKRCDKSLFTGKHYGIPGSESVTEPMYTEKKFDHF
jgi:sulfatase maturation enzyme AslB (radical SAM superfamily)